LPRNPDSGCLRRPVRQPGPALLFVKVFGIGFQVHIGGIQPGADPLDRLGAHVPVGHEYVFDPLAVGQLRRVAGKLEKNGRFGVGLIAGVARSPVILPSRSAGIWAMSAFWQNRHLKLQPTVAMEKDKFPEALLRKRKMLLCFYEHLYS
jgi:hypothetical protein